MRRIRSTGTVRAALVAVLMVVTGCGSSSGGGDSVGKEVLSNLSEFEVRALGDKVVTYAEMEEAGQIVVECLEEHGMEAGFEFSGGSMIYESDWTPPETWTQEEIEAGLDQIHADMEYCTSLVNAVTSVWDLQNQGSEEERQIAKENYVICVMAAGVEVSSGGDDYEVATAVNDFLNDPSSSDSARAAVYECADALSGASVVAPDGLAEALAELDLSAYD